MAATIDLAHQDTVMADAGQPMGLALTVVVEARNASGAEVIDIVAVATFGPRAEGQHDPLPFSPVGPDGGPV